MPPQAASSFVGMSGKLTKKDMAKTTPMAEKLTKKGLSMPREEPKRSSWNARSSSKVTPKAPSPQKAPPATMEKRRSKSGVSTPLKHEPLKSCLKKPGSQQPKSILSSPPLSHRSDCTQLSMRTDASSFEHSGVLHDDDDDDDGAPNCKSVSEPEQPETPPAAWTPSPTPSIADEPGYPEHRNSNLPETRTRGRRGEFPAAFVEAFSRDEDSVADSPHTGPYLLKLARLHASGENPVKALEYCIRAVKFYERRSELENVLDLIISLHILAAVHCHLGQYEDAAKLLERSLTLPDLDRGGEDHALAAFNGHMQLGDTLNMMGKLAASLEAYRRALEVQKSVMGELDVRVADTCIYIAEAHMQALEFAEARELCEYSLSIHTQVCEPGSVEEASDHRLLAIICSSQGEHGKALDSLVYANDIFVNFDLQLDVATGNQSIGDELLALGRDTEALQCFEKCVADFTMLQGEHDAMVASAHTSLADLFLRTNHPDEAKRHCQQALQIYAKPGARHVPCDVAYGLVAIAAVLEQLNEHETAILLLQRAFNIQDRIPGQLATVAGVEAQIGVLHTLLHRFPPALQSFQSAVSKMKRGTLPNSPLVGLVLNQMGVASVEVGDVPQAALLFEEAKEVMESTAGGQHLDTLDVCNNLANAYANMDRVEEAQELLEEVVRVKEEKLGAVHPDVCEDRARLQALLLQAQETTAPRSTSCRWPTTSRKLVGRTVSTSSATRPPTGSSLRFACGHASPS